MTTPTNKRNPIIPIGRRLLNMTGKRPASRRSDAADRPKASGRHSNKDSRSDINVSRRHSQPHRPNNQNPRRLKLPFENRRRRGDAGEWVFEHRVGLLVTIVIYLIASILFVSYRIVIYDNPAAVMYVELVNPEELEPEKPKDIPKPIEKINSAQYEQVTNRSSDENAKMNASLKDDRGTLSSELYEEAERVQRELAAGRQALEEGMDAIDDISNRNKSQKSSSANKSSSSNKQTTKVQGNVTVSYNLAGRTATYLHMPAYQCKDGGTVVVGITVNRSGAVIDATVKSSSASPNDCITTRAVQSAYASDFNADANAPNRQNGIITYIFVAQ